MDEPHPCSGFRPPACPAGPVRARAPLPYPCCYPYAAPLPPRSGGLAPGDTADVVYDKFIRYWETEKKDKLAKGGKPSLYWVSLRTASYGRLFFAIAIILIFAALQVRRKRGRKAARRPIHARARSR